MHKLGGMGKILDMIPGLGQAEKNSIDLERGEKEINGMAAIIQSMTKEERKDPSILNAGRRKRISAGSGQSVSSINQMMKKYNEMRQMMKKFSSNPKALKRNRIFKGLF